MNLLLFAQEVAKTAEGLPYWLQLVLGPLGVLVVLCIYAYRTEKHRIPTLSKLLAAEQMKNDTLRDDAEKKEDILRQQMRDEYEPRLTQLGGELKTCREKYTKERGLRTWWQAQAQAGIRRTGGRSS